MADKIFPEGIRIFQSDNTPDFVIGNIIISLNDLIKFCKEHPEYLTEYKGAKQLKLQALKSRGGKAYLAIDNYKKEDGTENNSQEPENNSEPDDLPF